MFAIPGELVEAERIANLPFAHLPKRWFQYAAAGCTRPHVGREWCPSASPFLQAAVSFVVEARRANSIRTAMLD